VAFEFPPGGGFPRGSAPYLPTYDRDLHVPGSMQNPDSTLPFPSPGTQASSGWYSGPALDLLWFNGVAPVVRAATWLSPLYDLQPQFRGTMQATGSSSTGSPPGVQPIWQGGKLHVQITGINALPSSLTDLVVIEQEAGNVGDLRVVDTVMPFADVTDQFVPGQDSTLIVIEPVAGIRYWQVKLIFQKLSALPDPLFRVSAAYY
jgi:hypothetical protein